MSETSNEGVVLSREPEGSPVVVHEDQGGDYALADIVEFFQLGEIGVDDEGRDSLTIDRESLVKLKALADAYSFDYDEGLILLCLDLARHAEANPREQYRFIDAL